MHLSLKYTTANKQGKEQQASKQAPNQQFSFCVRFSSAVRTDCPQEDGTFLVEVAARHVRPSIEHLKMLLNDRLHKRRVSQLHGLCHDFREKRDLELLMGKGNIRKRKRSAL